MNYKFDENGFLLPQQVRKYELAFAYNRHPYNFRQEIMMFLYVEPLNRYYSAEEVTKIQNHLGRLTISDFENSKPRADLYLKKLRNKHKKRIIQQN